MMVAWVIWHWCYLFSRQQQKRFTSRALCCWSDQAASAALHRKLDTHKVFCQWRLVRSRTTSFPPFPKVEEEMFSKKGISPINGVRTGRVGPRRSNHSISPLMTRQKREIRHAFLFRYSFSIYIYLKLTVRDALLAESKLFWRCLVYRQK